MRKSITPSKWYVADFETTGENYYKEYGCTKVWLYAICDSESNIVNYGSSIDEFFKWMEENTEILIYFHNLKFDSSFILCELNNRGFKWVDKLNKKSNKGYTTLIGEMGEFYQIQINFARNKRIIIQDSLKLINSKVEKIAVDFGLEIKKGIIDYDDYTIDNERLEYVFNDVKIVAQALAICKENGLTKMTTASSAMNVYKSTNRYFDWWFPDLSDEFLDKYRKAYRGGRSQVNPLYKDKVLVDVKRYDINSMYPSIMFDSELPYGEPIKINKRGEYKFELYDVDIDFKLKKGHLPTLLRKTGLMSNSDSYYIDSGEIINIQISNIDLDLLYKHYDVKFISFQEMLGFKTCRDLFKVYVDKYYTLKNNSKGAKKAVWKIFLNALYGKFGSNFKGYMKIPRYDKGVLYFEKSEEKTMKKYYLPLAIAVTSYAHKLLDDNIMETGYDKFVYCDTDSIHTLGELPSEMIDNKALGKFKLEAIEKRSKYVRQKCYVVEDDDGFTITCAGMTDGIKNGLVKMHNDGLINIFDEFKTGLVINPDHEMFKIYKGDKDIKPKLLPKQVKGGCILFETGFRIQE